MKPFYCSLFLCCVIYFNLFAQVNINPKNIQIVRDSFGVPHIYAKTDIEVAYGLGWATAEDDFKTMQWSLLAAKGMQARYFGIEGAKVDYAGKLLRARKIVQEQYDKALSTQFKNMLTAYCMAVNKYAALHPKEVLVKKAFPVTEEDVVTGYVLSFCLMSGVSGVLEDILSGKADENEIRNGGIGSNAFAFNSNKTKDGKTYLAINSHQPLEGPLSWYEVHLQSEEGWNIIGGTFHGGLSVFHGTNQHLGWAHTVNDFDVVDTYRLQMNPKNKNEYWLDNKWERLETEKVWLKVKVFKKLNVRLPVRKKAYWSKFGAVMKGKDGVYAVRLAANQDIRSSEQWYHMNKAQNFSQFYKALQMNAMARMTTVYADKYDTIFAISTGKIAKRNPNYNWTSVLPGNTSATLWNNYHAIEDLPQIINPACGVLFNVNNTAFDVTCKEENLKPENYDATMGYGTNPTNRSIRFHELLQQYQGKINYDEFKTIKFDKQYPKEFASLFGINLNWIFTMNPDSFPEITDELLKIHQWNRKATTDNKELPIFLYSFWQLNNRKNNITSEQKKSETAMHEIFASCVKDARSEMLKWFGTTNLTLGEVQRHTRGNVDLPCDGGPDLIKAAYGFQRDDKNRFRVFVGESYIQLVQFDKNGPIIESINAYGASAKPESKHYTDQMQQYVDLKLKPMTFDKATILKQAESIYSPE